MRELGPALAAVPCTLPSQALKAFQLAYLGEVDAQRAARLRRSLAALHLFPIMQHTSSSSHRLRFAFYLRWFSRPINIRPQILALNVGEFFNDEYVL
jgi:hypothetical protein